MLLAKTLSRRVFSSKELHAASAMPAAARLRFLSGLFAVKEAVSKAIGTGLEQGFNMAEVECLTGNCGEISVRLTGETGWLASSKDIDSVMASVSHVRSFAVAIAAARLREG